MTTLLLLLCTGFTTLAQDAPRSIDVNGVERSYILHLPATFDQQKMYPVVFVFHGGGGTAKSSISFFGMNAVADTAGFIVVYPNGLNRGWNDGRQIRNHTHDDVGFIRQLLLKLLTQYRIDRNRIFATGISNGGFFSFAVGLHLADMFRAIAPVSATIPLDIFPQYNPSRPLSLLLINGTDDPLVPYNGGKVGGRWLNRGECSSTDTTMTKFIEVNHCHSPQEIIIENSDPHDGCKATRFVYTCQGSEVQLIRIDGGGHTWPGGKQYLRKRLIGNVCRDFSASAEIWRFFRKF